MLVKVTCFVIIILLGFGFIDARPSSSNGEEEKDCIVRQSYSFEHWQGETIRFMAFIEHGEKLSSITGFKGQHTGVVYDKILMSQEEIILAETRNGNVEYTDLKSYLDVAGWVGIEVSVNNHQYVFKYGNTTAFHYTVDQQVYALSVQGSYISICEDGSPTWTLDHGKSAKIPIEPSRQTETQFSRRTYPLTLRSLQKDFTPRIRVDENKAHLELTNNKTNLASSSKLPAGTWDLDVEIINGFINIYEKIDGKQKILISYQTKGMKFIEVSSNHSRFSVSLGIFNFPKPTLPLTAVGIEGRDNDAHADRGFKLNATMVISFLIGVTVCLFVVVLVLAIKRSDEVTGSMDETTAQQSHETATIDLDTEPNTNDDEPIDLSFKNQIQIQDALLKVMA